MPKVMLEACYTTSGVQGLIKGGGSARKKAVEQMVKSLKGTVESFYFAFGDTDVVVIADFPDNESVAACSATVGASGAASVKTTILLTTAEMDRAAKKKVTYKKPGPPAR